MRGGETLDKIVNSNDYLDVYEERKAKLKRDIAKLVCESGLRIFDIREILSSITGSLIPSEFVDFSA